MRSFRFAILSFIKSIDASPVAGCTAYHHLRFASPFARLRALCSHAERPFYCRVPKVQQAPGFLPSLPLSPCDSLSPHLRRFFRRSLLRNYMNIMNACILLTALLTDDKNVVSCLSSLARSAEEIAFRCWRARAFDHEHAALHLRVRRSHIRRNILL